MKSLQNRAQGDNLENYFPFESIVLMVARKILLKCPRNPAAAHSKFYFYEKKVNELIQKLFRGTHYSRHGHKSIAKFTGE